MNKTHILIFTQLLFDENLSFSANGHDPSKEGNLKFPCPYYQNKECP